MRITKWHKWIAQLFEMSPRDFKHDSADECRWNVAHILWLINQNDQTSAAVMTGRRWDNEQDKLKLREVVTFLKDLRLSHGKPGNLEAFKQIMKQQLGNELANVEAMDEEEEQAA